LTRRITGDAVNTRLIYLTIAALGWTAAAALHEIPARQHASPVRLATPPCGPDLGIKNTANDSRCFELRTYTLAEGSSADVLHARFRERTIALFRKHGMTIIGFWQPVARLDQLVYILAYRDAAARDSAWAAFNTDPEWLKTRTEMKVTVDVDNTFMVATDYSPLK
jgi:NIPSNAP